MKWLRTWGRSSHHRDVGEIRPKILKQWDESRHWLPHSLAKDRCSVCQSGSKNHPKAECGVTPQGDAYKLLHDQGDWSHMTRATEDKGTGVVSNEGNEDTSRSWRELMREAVFWPSSGFHCCFLCGRNQSQHSWSRLIDRNLLSEAPGWRSLCRAGTQL